MKLYSLGLLPWQETQGLYHALAQDGQEALVLCRPLSRYVCLGFHDDFAQEIDSHYCQTQAIPLLRREAGGGVVLLDAGQLFFQLILKKDNPLLRGRRDRFFAAFLQPAVHVLRGFGLDAAVRLPADIAVGGRKISGNGAGDIGGCAVYIGNILVQFDRKAMAGVLRCPNEEFRSSVRQSMERELTTMSEELGRAPAMDLLTAKLTEQFFAAFGAMEPAEYSPELKGRAVAAARRLTSPEALALPGRTCKARQVKIREGVNLRLHWYREDGGATGYGILLIDDGIIQNFECFNLPQTGGLGRFLTGTAWTEKTVAAAVSRWRAVCRHARDMDADLTVNWIMKGI